MPSMGSSRIGTDVDRAVEILRNGGLVAFPTETVYGLGADASSPAAVRRIFAAKGRPADHPLIVHLGAADQVDGWALDVPVGARELAARFWPGPLTLVLWRRVEVIDEVTGGRDTVGLRVPAHPVALLLLQRFGSGLAAPSANRFGQVSPTTAQDVVADLGGAVDYVLDGGPCSVGVESTIVEMTGPVPMVLRHGGIAVEELEATLHHVVERVASGPSRASGMLDSHYAPRARVEVLDRTAARRRVAELGRSARLLDPDVGVDEYARSLYRWLREADRDGVEILVAVPPADTGIGVAVNDRLRKAAAPRPAG